MICHINVSRTHGAIIPEVTQRILCRGDGSTGVSMDVHLNTYSELL